MWWLGEHSLKPHLTRPPPGASSKARCFSHLIFPGYPGHPLSHSLEKYCILGSDISPSGRRNIDTKTQMHKIS
jgi:hypothetical protein